MGRRLVPYQREGERYQLFIAPVHSDHSLSSFTVLKVSRHLPDANKAEYDGDDEELGVVGHVPRPQHAELALREQIVDVQGVSPPVPLAGDVVDEYRAEHRVAVIVPHSDHVHSQYVHVGRCETNVSVERECGELEGVRFEYRYGTFGF